MAIQPSPRLAGSSHILRFEGALFEQAVPGVQTINGEVGVAPVAGALVTVRFALADMSAISANPSSLADKTRRLPGFVFDDSQPTGSPTPGSPPESPHSNTLGAMGPVGQKGKTYAQNIRVRAISVPADPLVPEVLTFNELTPLVQLDGAAGSGLGLEQDTGVPVLLLSMAFTAAGVAALSPQGAGTSIVLEIEVPHTTVR